MESKSLPLILKIEKAKNELRFQINNILEKYELPRYLLDLVIESLLSEERGQRLALMTEQITVKEEDIDGKHKDLP